jgi:AraC-like DNA-binding protein
MEPGAPAAHNQPQPTSSAAAGGADGGSFRGAEQQSEVRPGGAELSRGPERRTQEYALSVKFGVECVCQDRRMRKLYDTSEVHALDRFAYYQSAAVGEFAPVLIGGQSPGRLSASMAVDQIGDLMVETYDWESDGQLEVHRTPRLIRAADPECFRILLSVHGGFGVRQDDHVVEFVPRDIALYDTSRPWSTRHPPNVATPKQTVMLTFPRSLVPADIAQIDRYVGTVFPRHMRAHSLIADLLVELTEPHSWLVDRADRADLVRECVLGLLRERLGRAGIATRFSREIQIARIRTIIRSQLSQPTLRPAQIAKMAHVSARSLHQLLHATGTTPMALVKHLRLEECRRRLTDPALAEWTINDIALSLGYRRQDQFARDFKQMFGVSARTIRP